MRIEALADVKRSLPGVGRRSLLLRRALDAVWWESPRFLGRVGTWLAVAMIDALLMDDVRRSIAAQGESKALAGTRALY